MSTTLYLYCTSHEPWQSSDEVGNHGYDLPNVRKMLANREKLIEAYKVVNDVAAFDIDLGDLYRNSVMYFMLSHPNCEYKIVDEYGYEYDLDGESRQPKSGEKVVIHR